MTSTLSLLLLSCAASAPQDRQVQVHIFEGRAGKTQQVPRLILLTENLSSEDHLRLARAALACTGSDPRPDEALEFPTVVLSLARTVEIDGLRTTIALDLTPVLEEIRRIGVEDVLLGFEATVAWPEIAVPHGVREVEPDAEIPDYLKSRNLHLFKVGEEADALEVRLAYGPTPLALALLVPWFLIPVLMRLSSPLLERLARRLRPDDPRAAAMIYTRSILGVIVVGTIAYLYGGSGSGADQAAEFLLVHAGVTWGGVLLRLGWYLVVGVVLTYVHVTKVAARFRGATLDKPGESARIGCFTVLWFFLLIGSLGFIFTVGITLALPFVQDTGGDPLAWAAWAILVLVFYGAYGGFILLTGYLMLRTLRGRRLPPEDPLAAAVAELCARTGTRLPSVWTLEMREWKLGLACAAGGWRSSILVSDSMRELLTPEELETVLVHELGHVRHRDSQKVLLAMLLAPVPYAVAVALFAGGFGVRFASAAIIGLGVLGLAWFGYKAWRRTLEVRADRYVWEASREPRLFPDALLKIYGLNQMDTGSERGFNLVLDHPHLKKRIDLFMRQAPPGAAKPASGETEPT